MNPLLSYGIAAAVGAAYQWAAAAFWGYYVQSSPLQDHLVRGHIGFSYAHDMALNLLIAIPFAAVFRYIPALRNWCYLAVAVAAALLLTYGSSLGSLAGLMSIPRFWAGVAYATLSLPAAYFVLNLFGRGDSSARRVLDAA